MKKIKLTKMEIAQMSIGQKELSKLKGGYDVINTNTNFGCYCEYNNQSLTNSNSVYGCECRCI